MRGLMRVYWLCALCGGSLLIAVSAWADALEVQCREVDRTRQAACDMQRPADGEWVLNTRVEVATGRKAAVESLAREFCLAAGRAGVAARVSHMSQLPGSFREGARMNWRCALPAVSASPPSR